MPIVQNKANFVSRIAYIVCRVLQNKANLGQAEIIVTIYAKDDYEEIASGGGRKNKANSKPNVANVCVPAAKFCRTTRKNMKRPDADMVLLNSLCDFADIRSGGPAETGITI